MDFNLTNTWYLIAAVCGLFLLVSIVSYRRSDLPSAGLGKKLVLILLRTSVLGLALFLLLDPHRVQENTYREKMEFAVLLDASASMAYADDRDTEANARWQDAVEYLEHKVLPSLRDDYIVTTYTFGERLSRTTDVHSATPAEVTSNLASALEEVLADGREVALGGILVISDGQLDDKEQIIKAVRKYRRGNIPIYTYSCGLAQEAPDVVLRGVQGDQIVPFEPRVRLVLNIDSPGFAGQQTLVSVQREDRLLYERPLELTGQPLEHTIEFDSPYRGFYAYDVALSVQDGERLAYNNATRVGLDVLDQKIRVLYMEGTSNSTHTLEDALELDPDIEVVSLYFPQRVSNFEQAKQLPYQKDAQQRRIYNVGDPRRGFPQTLESLLQYDVIINSDIYRQAFTQEQLDNTVALVEEFGGGFVMVGGVTAFGAGHYDETVIDKLMPVDCYGARDYTYNRFQLQIPEQAFDHPIMQVGESPGETRLAWTERFPGFRGLNKANRPKPGALSLARHESMRNQYGNLVVFAVQQIGRGRTMAFTPDTTEDWGLDFEARWGRDTDRTYYYRRFWNNAIRWLAADRIQRKSKELVVRCSAHEEVPGEPVTVAIPIPEGAPAKSINLRCDYPDGTQQLLETSVDPVEQALRTDFTPSQLGTHTFTARLQRADDDLVFAKNMIHVKEDRREESTTKANPQLLERLATITNASSLNEKPTDYLHETLGELGTEFVEYKQMSVWDSLPVMSVLLGFLAIEWFLRRMSGFV